MHMLIKNVKIISPYEVLEGLGVKINEGKIVEINLDHLLEDSEGEIIDGGGNYLSPGFIDIHNHGNSGYDVMDSTEEALDKIGEFHLSNGVTSYLGTIITSSYENIIKAMKNIVDYENKLGKANILGIHLEGPFFHLEKKGAQPEEYIKLPDLNRIQELLEIARGKLKMVSLAPELKGSIEVIAKLKASNVAVAMAHTNATFESAQRGINSGITIATHLYNGMRSFNHREPGVIGASLLDNRVYCELIYDRIHLHDAAAKMALRMKGYDKIVLVSDAMMAAGLGDGEYLLGNQKVFVKDGAAKLASGSLAGSTLNLKQAVYNMVKFLEVPIHEAVKMASLNPAKAINRGRELGSIRVGKRADLIIFDENLDIKHTISGGNQIW
ncbi:MAG: N-acetylglucosamine-6-phosphate deacetylase [Tissierellia bacterium]|nr:N-acetylglucosamine-6-phosphate deacetylase [Tissierellia bacterium]